MKYVKILGLLAVAAAALMAFAGTASADTVTTGTTAAETPEIHAVSVEGAVAGTKHVSLHNSIANIECESTVTGLVTEHEAGQPVRGHISQLLFTNCTNSWTVTVNTPGTLSVESTTGENGTLFSNEATVTAARHTIFGTVECRYKTEGTHIGTVTGTSTSSMTGAVLHIEASIPFDGGSGLCGSGNSAWTGTYQTTESLTVHNT